MGGRAVRNLLIEVFVCGLFADRPSRKQVCGMFLPQRRTEREGHILSRTLREFQCPGPERDRPGRG
jgi:hypothetical protein